jgi:hypothetical protein
MTKKLPEVCYLCGERLIQPIDYDHVPMKQLWAPQTRKEYALQLLTIPVHKTCNSSYQRDEDYLIKTILPFVPQSPSGSALFWKAIDEYHRGQNRPLMQKVLKEFERAPSGLKLPRDKIVKRFDGKRVTRVAWKIVRGLHFHHTGQVLPDIWTKSVDLHLADENWDPPDHFKAFMAMPNNVEHGKYGGVFSYRFLKFPEANDLHYWAMLILDRIIVIVMFHDLSCGCAECAFDLGEELPDGRLSDIKISH